MWNKHGIIYSDKKAQLPVVEERNCSWRIYFTSRNKLNQNEGYFIDVKKGKPSKILAPAKQMLVPGKPGSTDSAGVMPVCKFEDKLYYIGWTIRQDVPYYNYCSVAEEGLNAKFKKLGPILSPNVIDQGYSGTICVIKLNNVYMGYYLSCNKWLPDENGNLQPSYNIRLATSEDGIYWNKSVVPTIKLRGEEAGISAATVYKHKDIFHMWFSVRNSIEFRTNPEHAYTIQHATSKDGYVWSRDTKFGIVQELEFESIMCAYPAIIPYKDKLHMFYNGNGFGKTGIAHATMDIDKL
jgi:hypothetical protein